MRYSIRLSYNGSAFNGWQIQKNGPSVQETLQRALSLATREDIGVTGAGRTDTAVNAVNYIAHFDMENPGGIAPEQLTRKLNAILPAEITVHEIIHVKDDFHARFSARSREYRYFMHQKKDPFAGHFSYFCRYPVDVEKMNRAASYLIGTHDFSCFEKTGGGNATSICTVTEAEWTSYSPAHVEITGYEADEGDYLVFRIRADRFLRNMVRAVVGSLIDVGRGRRDPEWIKTLIENGSRSDAGESVPGKALFLSGVEYPSESGADE